MDTCERHSANTVTGRQRGIDVTTLVLATEGLTVDDVPYRNVHGVARHREPGAVVTPHGAGADNRDALSLCSSTTRGVMSGGSIICGWWDTTTTGTGIIIGPMGVVG